MKAIRYILGLIVFLAVLLEAARGISCHSSTECLPNECCMTKSAFLGGCRERGCEGCTCQPENVKSGLGDMYFMTCPCLDGLVCVPAAVVENQEDRTIQYLNSTCQTKEALLTLYKRLLESKKLHPRLLTSLFKDTDILE